MPRLLAIAVLICLPASLAAEPAAQMKPAQVQTPHGDYAFVTLRFEAPEPWTYVGGMRGGVMPIDHGVGIRESGGTLTLKDGRLAGKFRRALAGGKTRTFVEVEVDAAVRDGSVEGEAVVNGRRTKVGGQVVPEAELSARNALPADKGWPRFLGPTGTGTAAQATGAGLIDSPADIRLAWRSEPTDIGQGIGSISRFMHNWADANNRRTGSGSASPILADGKVYLYYYVPSPARREYPKAWLPAGYADFDKSLARLAEQSGLDQEAVPLHAREKIYEAVDDVVVCLDAATGKTLWRTAMPDRSPNMQHHKAGPFNMTPGYADGRVFAVGMNGVLYALDAATGKPLWEKPLDVRPFSVSVVALPGVVVVPRGNVWCSLNPADGSELWKSTIRFSNASVAVWEHQGRHYILSGEGERLIDEGRGEDLLCLDALTGQEAWRLKFDQPTAVQSQGRGSGPGGICVIGDTLLAYLQMTHGDDKTARRANLKLATGAWQLSPQGAKRLWQVEAASNGEHVPVVLHGRYAVLGDLQVIDIQSGEKVAQGEGIVPSNGGYLQAMEDLLFVRRDGTHGRIEFAIHRVGKDGSIKSLTGETLWQPPVGGQTTSYHHPIMYPMLDGRVFLRQEDGVYCWDFRKPANQERRP